MNQPKISIIVPVYNVEPYIAECIQSVMQQTYQGPMECILVDDCCKDNSMEVAIRLIAEYKGPIEFVILHHEKNRGVSAARNTGTDIVKGDCVYYLDSDDAISSNCIELLVDVVMKHPKVEVVQGAVESINYRKYNDLRLYDTPRYIESNEWVRYHSFRAGEELPICAWNKLIKRSFLVENSLAFKEGINNEDELWSFGLYKRVKYWAVIGDKTYLHYRRQNSIMTTLTAQKRANDMAIVLIETMKEIDNPYYDLQVFKCLNWFIYYVFPYSTNRVIVKRIYFHFFICLLRMNLKLAFWLVVGCFNRSKRRWLFYEKIPQDYMTLSDKLSYDNNMMNTFSE